MNLSEEINWNYATKEMYGRIVSVAKINSIIKKTLLLLKISWFAAFPHHFNQ